MKQRLFNRLFIIFPAVLCLSMISIGSALAADPVTIRYEVASHQTSLGFVRCYNENGERTELLSDGTTTWSYQFTTTNPGQLVSVYPVPVDNPNAAISMVTRVYINGVLYRTVTGQNAAAATIHDTLDNLLAAGTTRQWNIRYEVSSNQTTLDYLAYSHNQSLNEIELMAEGTTTWTREYTTANVDQPIRIKAGPVVPADHNKVYTVDIKIFVNNELLYNRTFRADMQQVVVDEKLSSLLTGRPLLNWADPVGRPTVITYPGYPPQATGTLASSTYPIVISFGSIESQDSNQLNATGIQLSLNQETFYVIIGTAGPQQPGTKEPVSIAKQ